MLETLVRARAWAILAATAQVLLDSAGTRPTTADPKAAYEVELTRRMRAGASRFEAMNAMRRERPDLVAARYAR